MSNLWWQCLRDLSSWKFNLNIAISLSCFVLWTWAYFPNGGVGLSVGESRVRMSQAYGIGERVEKPGVEDPRQMRNHTQLLTILPHVLRSRLHAYPWKKKPSWRHYSYVGSSQTVRGRIGGRIQSGLICFPQLCSSWAPDTQIYIPRSRIELETANQKLNCVNFSLSWETCWYCQQRNNRTRLGIWKSLEEGTNGLTLFL